MTRRLTLLLPTLLAALLAVVVLVPLSMMFTVSLNPDEARIQIGLGTIEAFIPHVVSLENYRQVLGDPHEPFLRYLLNTLVVVTGVVGLGLVVNAAAAFALAWGRGPYRKAFVATVIAVYVIPGESLVLPLLLMMSRIGWVDSYQVQIVPFIANAFAIFLFYQFFSSMPRELIEAAKIDGAGLLQVFFRIGLPLSMPVVSTLAILGFLDAWNSYLWPMMVTRGPEYRPLSVAMAAYFTSQQAFWGNVMAFAVLMTLPVLIVYLIFQRWFVASVMTSGVKG